MRHLWHRFLAWTRISPRWVCELSKGRGPRDDYHDYPDTEDGYPAHFVLLRCKRCGKEFYI